MTCQDSLTGPHTCINSEMPIAIVFWMKIPDRRELCESDSITYPAKSFASVVPFRRPRTAETIVNNIITGGFPYTPISSLLQITDKPETEVFGESRRTSDTV